jgi:drug/metabolite transporter (DMT)-like permease
VPFLESPMMLGSLAMLGSAIAHAGMTLLTKQAEDRLVFRMLALTIGALIYLPWLVFQPFPDWEVWKFLLTSSAVIWIYNMLMIEAFNRGDMNLVYPVMRGMAPLLAATLAWIALGETISVMGMVGLGIASLAIIGFSWPEKGTTPKTKVLLFAMAASIMTGFYTVIDAAGVRLLEAPFVYAGWFFVTTGISLIITAYIRRPGRLLAASKMEFRRALTSTGFNLSTYSLALLAYSIAPIAPMAALRETSIVFGAILAAVVLKEAFGLRRILLAMLLAGGLLMIQAF